MESQTKHPLQQSSQRAGLSQSLEVGVSNWLTGAGWSRPLEMVPASALQFYESRTANSFLNESPPTPVSR